MTLLGTLFVATFAALLGAYVGHRLTLAHMTRQDKVAAARIDAQTIQERDEITSSLRASGPTANSEGFGLSVLNRTVHPIIIRKVLLTDDSGKRSVIMTFTGYITDIKSEEAYDGGEPAQEIGSEPPPKLRPNKAGWIELPSMSKGDWITSTMPLNTDIWQPAAFKITVSYRSASGKEDVVTVSAVGSSERTIAEMFEQSRLMESTYRNIGKI